MAGLTHGWQSSALSGHPGRSRVREFEVHEVPSAQSTYHTGRTGNGSRLRGGGPDWTAGRSPDAGAVAYEAACPGRFSPNSTAWGDFPHDARTQEPPSCHPIGETQGAPGGPAGRLAHRGMLSRLAMFQGAVRPNPRRRTLSSRMFRSAVVCAGNRLLPSPQPGT
jgi:hypothetical protein